jgi:hypothetical protein
MGITKGDVGFFAVVGIILGIVWLAVLWDIGETSKVETGYQRQCENICDNQSMSIFSYHDLTCTCGANRSYSQDNETKVFYMKP